VLSGDANKYPCVDIFGQGGVAMTIRVVADSTCDLPKVVAEAFGITVVPAYINIGERSFLDGVELTRQEFYEMLPSYEVVPTTSIPSIEAFLRVYEKLSAEGAAEILSIHIASSLSGTCDVARSAAARMSPDQVTIFDSGQLSLGTGLLILAAAEAAAGGLSLTEIVSMLQEKAPRTYTFAALDTLEFLRRSGRVSRFRSSFGSLLRIKPLLTMHMGEVSFGKVRTRNRSVDWLLERVGALAPLEKLALVHTHAQEKAARLQQKAKHLFPKGEEPLCAEVTPVIGAHVGPGAVGFACIAAGAS
jgi:DegV family protein with EDD domain